MRSILMAGILIWLATGCGEKEETSNESSPEVQTDKGATSNQKASLNLEFKEEQKLGISNDLETEVKNGPVKFYYPNDMLKAEGHMKDGQRDGVWKYYYDSGKQWSVNYYDDGKLDGHSVTYFRNGQVRYVGDYRNGKRVGLWKFYNKEGTLLKEQNFSEE